MKSEMLPYKKMILHVAASFALSACNLVKTKKLKIADVLAHAQQKEFFTSCSLRNWSVKVATGKRS